MDLTWRIAALKRDITAFEQDFKRDCLAPKYAQRWLWLIAPNASRNPDEPDLDPRIIAWLEAACADTDGPRQDQLSRLYNGPACLFRSLWWGATVPISLVLPLGNGIRASGRLGSHAHGAEARDAHAVELVGETATRGVGAALAHET